VVLNMIATSTLDKTFYVSAWNVRLAGEILALEGREDVKS